MSGDPNDIEVFSGSFTVIDGGIDENYAYKHKPFYVQINRAGGGSFRVLGMHLKSKGAFWTYEWSEWWQIADANRRTVRAQATQVGLGFLDPYMIDAETKEILLIFRGDINERTGLDARKKRLLGSGVERLMGTVWRPELCLRNALYGSLTDEERAELNFGLVTNTSFQDPIFNNTWHWEWIDHILHNEAGDEPWVTNAEDRHHRSEVASIWKAYSHASDHYFVSAEVVETESLEGV